MDVLKIPKGTHFVGSKWVFTIKYRSDGKVERYKARLVAKGFSQKYVERYKARPMPTGRILLMR